MAEFDATFLVGEKGPESTVGLPQIPPPSKPKVAIAWVHPDAGRVSSFEDSRDAMKDWDVTHSQFIQKKITVRFGTGGIVDARNKVAMQLLASDCDWLLWVDTDMGFEADALDKLMAVADPDLRPIMGGLCFQARQVAHDGMNGYWAFPQPTLFDWKDNPDGGSGFTITPMYPINGLMQLAATGCAFILIHRSVFERMAENYGPTWYDRTPAPDGQLLGEDISFCVRANLLEIPVFVYTGVKTSHYKGFWLQERDHWRQYVAPPATEPVAVVVPVLRRPQNAAPFMASLRASTALAKAYAICDADDEATIEAWRVAGAETVVIDPVWFADNLDAEGNVLPSPNSFPVKANAGYLKTSEPWIFLTGDDVRFHAGWLDHAEHVADIFKADVVGTNDAGNARVMRGEHATHMLIRRSYVDAQGASWDGPGVVACESYRHNFVDDELVLAAKQRGVWQAALGSIVEHNHPMWGKGEDDEVYQLGQESFDADRDLFIARMAANS